MGGRLTSEESNFPITISIVSAEMVLLTSSKVNENAIRAEQKENNRCLLALCVDNLTPGH